MPSRKNFPERKLKRKLEAEERQKRFEALPVDEQVKRKGCWSSRLLAEVGEEIAHAGKN